MNSNVVLREKSECRFELYKVILVLIFAFCLLLPIGKMLLGITGNDFGRVFSQPDIFKIIGNSFTVSLTATVITVTAAYLLALCTERVSIKGKSVLGVIMLMPMLIPSISHGMGLVILFGNNGIVKRFLGLNTNIYGFWGIVTGAFLYSFPVAFIMFRDIMKYENGSPYEAAMVLGISKRRRFTGITLPFLRKPLISIVFSVFTLIITDYGVPLMVGGKYKTIAVTMYQDVIGQLDFGKGSVYGVILLIPAVVAFLFDLFNKDKGNAGFITSPVEPSQSKTAKIFAYIFSTAVSIFILLPIFSFLILGFSRKYPSDMSFSLYNLDRVMSLGGGRYLLNSIIIAFFVAAAGMCIAFITAYFTARMKKGISKFLHLTAITAMAVPGIVLGLSYAIFFNGSIIYGTLIILITVNFVHFVASPYLMMYNSLAKINENLEEVGKTLGISRFRMIKDVFLPQSVSTLAEMFLYFFVNSMMTISAVSFLANTSTKPISLMINQFEAQMQLGNAGIVSLFILIINLLIHTLTALIKRCVNKARQ